MIQNSNGLVQGFLDVWAQVLSISLPCHTWVVICVHYQVCVPHWRMRKGDKRKEMTYSFLLKVQFRSSTYYLWSYSIAQKMDGRPHLTILEAEICSLFLYAQLILPLWEKKRMDTGGKLAVFHPDLYHRLSHMGTITCPLWSTKSLSFVLLNLFNIHSNSAAYQSHLPSSSWK